MAAFVSGGGQLLVCPPCFKARGLDETSVKTGAVFGGGAKLVEFLSEGAACVSY
ncbi:hypothetical protein [Candidatus Dormiibacter inghamiae]|uniref:hypothetical protein n=1 Tax=Candidatus Dormiibacter inghamiae TaxID=3127013 RepID=UPI003312F881